MSNLETLVSRYIDTFNETDPKRRASLLAEVYAENCRYTDPLAHLEGIAAVDAFIAGVQQQHPGLLFKLKSGIDAHHDQARFSWEAGPPGASQPAVIGFDVIELSGGKIGRVLGFFDKVPGLPVNRSCGRRAWPRSDKRPAPR